MARFPRQIAFHIVTSLVPRIRSPLPLKIEMNSENDFRLYALQFHLPAPIDILINNSTQFFFMPKHMELFHDVVVTLHNRFEVNLFLNWNEAKFGNHVFGLMRKKEVLIDRKFDSTLN